MNDYKHSEFVIASNMMPIFTGKRRKLLYFVQSKLVGSVFPWWQRMRVWVMKRSVKSVSSFNFGKGHLVL